MILLLVYEAFRKEANQQFLFDRLILGLLFANILGKYSKKQQHAQ